MKDKKIVVEMKHEMIQIIRYLKCLIDWNKFSSTFEWCPNT
jgi:hypothetical protein